MLHRRLRHVNIRAINYPGRLHSYAARTYIAKLLTRLEVVVLKPFECDLVASVDFLIHSQVRVHRIRTRKSSTNASTFMLPGESNCFLFHKSTFFANRISPSFHLFDIAFHLAYNTNTILSSV